MIELLVLACLSADPTTCRSDSLLFADVSVMICVAQGQTQLSAWSEAHPGWTIKRWSCRLQNTAQAEL